MSLSVPRIALKSVNPTTAFVRKMGGGGHLRFNQYRHDYMSNIKPIVDNERLFKIITALVAIPVSITLYMGITDELRVHHSLPVWKENHREYPYRYIKRREFPWGDGNHTRFHGPNQFINGVGFLDHEDHH